VDVFTKEKRSEVMSRIRGRGNRSTEATLAESLRRNGIKGWRRHRSIRYAHKDRMLVVRPDFIFPKTKCAVFVDGCFWHQCPLHATSPASNKLFWKAKLRSNVERDRLATRLLRRLGWTVIRFWEHELTPKRGQKVIAKLRRAGLSSQLSRSRRRTSNASRSDKSGAEVRAMG
jgi:DNA mismatch endonuclease (patch repair protein)